ncbi:MAG: hypothetical protein JSR76_00045 [Verrucomicrobia bacterium]|nr:hypothetical protein [Verrucomicrobiota bacterium]
MVNKVKKEAGFTVAEIETHVKKYGVEVSLCGAFIISALFSLIWGGSILVWSILLAGLGAAFGVVFPKWIHKGSQSVLHFFTKEKVTRIVGATLLVAISFFLPFLIFLILGLEGGKSLATEMYKALGHESSHK